MWKVLVSFILAIFLLGCATEQKTIQIPQERCERPVWNEGDSWKFTGESGQWEEKIIKEGNTFKIKQTPRKDSYGVWGMIPIHLFPLWVGKRYEGIEAAQTIEGISLNYSYSLNVVELKDVSVEAGKFKCYKIEFKIYPVGYSTQVGIGHYHYSPETKGIIKFITQSRLLLKWENYELSSFNLKRESSKISLPEIKSPVGGGSVSPQK